MAPMDASQSALDSLRTVEFRETLKGYHRDDVDEYLEKAAVEAEGLQEQLRQSGERLRQAAERISQLETALEQQPLPPPPVEPAVPDDTLQRTLVLAQQFVDQTKADAEAKRRGPSPRPRPMRARRPSRPGPRRRRSRRSRSSGCGTRSTGWRTRSKLNNEVETMSRHLEGERNRLRTALSDILRWVDENVHPVSTHDDAPAAAAEPRPGPDPSPGPQAQAGTPEDGNRPAAAPTQGAPSQTGSGTGPSGAVTQMRPAGVTTRPTNTNAPLPL